MSLLRRALEAVGVLSPISRDDIINAEIEDKAREHENMIGAVHAALTRRKASNGSLRRSILIAQKKTNSFAEFERMVSRERRN